MAWKKDPRKTLRATEDFDLSKFQTNGKPGFKGNKKDGKALMKERGNLLAELQERLFAEGRAGGERSLLVVVQGLDTAGKGGVARHVMGMVDPQGVQLRSFGVPTEEELSHHFLWRIRRALPAAGKIGVFDRSHYEDVLVQRVDEIVEEDVWRKRYDEINRFEQKLVESGTTILKFALMVSHDEQGKRLMTRLDRPDKRWKYSKGDLKTRAKWDEYQEAYADVFRFTSTEDAPWYVVPADSKWFARAAITEIITRTMVDMRPEWPKPRFDVSVQRRDLAASMSLAALQESLEGTKDEVLGAIEESFDVRADAQELRGGGASRAKRAKQQREIWQQELADAIAQKKQLIDERDDD